MNADSVPRLTDRQAAILDKINESIRERGYPPTQREIGEALGIKSTNGVNAHLRALERKGVIRCDVGVSRGIVVLIKRDSAHERALLSEAARCAPIEAVRAALESLVQAHKEAA